ncbi:MAG: arginine--tRNA ligase [Flammeovirgaceae bacterium]
MSNITQTIIKIISNSLSQLSIPLPENQIALQPTNKEFEGHITFVTFPAAKIVKRKPEEIGEILGKHLVENYEGIARFNVVKGFLNLVLSKDVFLENLKNFINQENCGEFAPNGQRVMIEYSSPNTNKPLHFGHLRTNFLGFSLAQILKAGGYEVVMTNLVNDRGIHICKSMLAYQKFGNGETPQSSGIKGDHLVGKYYVLSNKILSEQTSVLMEKVNNHDFSEFTDELIQTIKTLQNRIAKNSEEAKDQLKELLQNQTSWMKEVKEMLQRWERGDAETMELWKKMNSWVYEGFEQTYKNIGVYFDKYYYESDTYLLGKDIIEQGLQKGIFYKRPDGSVWIDLRQDGLDEKLVLRADGTSVYITQDMGTADLKYKDFQMQKSIYVVGNEQDYHFKVLQLIMKKLGRSYADGIYHLSYGMINLPSGRMKSREGTVVDADDILQEMIDTARVKTQEQGKIEDFAEAENLYRQLALGALKYYILRVEPKKTMLFNPEESIDFHGNTGVFIQYNHTRLCSIKRKADKEGIRYDSESFEGVESLERIEEEIINLLVQYPQKVQIACELYAPSEIANYAYELAKLISKFWTELPILSEPDTQKRSLRVAICVQAARVLKKALGLLGIEAPERM